MFARDKRFRCIRRPAYGNKLFGHFIYRTCLVYQTNRPIYEVPVYETSGVGKMLLPVSYTGHSVYRDLTVPSLSPYHSQNDSHID